MTKAQTDALKWLREHGGSGVWDKKQRLIAAGEIAPVMRATWKRLADLGFVSLANRRVTLLPGAPA